MKTCLQSLLFLTLFHSLAGAQGTQNTFLELYLFFDGSIIIAQDSDNTYLGKITNEYDSDSIFNEYGAYGSEYSSKSIWNEYSTFGNV